MRTRPSILNASRTVLSLFLGAMISTSARAEVKLPALIADHMVLQRGLPVHIWGLGAAGEAVTVIFRGESRSATADELGRWGVYLPRGEAGGPFPLTVKGANTITFDDVLVGDVWLAGGQSNMQFPLRQAAGAEAEIAAADFPKIRFFHVNEMPSEFPLDNVDARTWAALKPETAPHVSAIAYFFAREIQRKTGVPIGVVESYWGGTTAEAWTSLRALSADAALMPVFAARARMAEGQSTVVLQLAKEEQDFQKAAAQAKAEGRPEPSKPWHPNFASWSPSSLYNGMIAPLTPFPIRGVIWYQGESNTEGRAPLYDRLFPTLIRDWRRAWGIGDFPFLYVQIANWETKPEDLWPEVRDAQRRTLGLANTAMAVTIDIGEAADIHPKNKKDVGLRLAMAARALVYGEKLEYSGPLFRQVTLDGSALRVWFDHMGAGLQAKGGDLKGFEVAGEDRRFVPAQARIDGDTVLASSSAVASPRYVRYGWAANPVCNLFNHEGLPASPFRSPE